MLSISFVIFLLILVLGTWLWSSNLQSRSSAIAAAQRACEQYGLQLLDGTTHFQRCKPKRHSNGRLGIARTYLFDYYDGEMRQQGEVIIFQRSVISMRLDKNTPDQPPSTPPTTVDNVIKFPNKD